MEVSILVDIFLLMCYFSLLKNSCFFMGETDKLEIAFHLFIFLAVIVTTGIFGYYAVSLAVMFLV